MAMDFFIHATHPRHVETVALLSREKKRCAKDTGIYQPIKHLDSGLLIRILKDTSWCEKNEQRTDRQH